MAFPGVYVEGSVEGVELLFTVDTGATRTILSDHIYYQIPEQRRPSLKKSACLTGANGQPIKELGKATFHLLISSLKLEREVVVAEIKDDCLLGIDILQNQSEGSADLLLSKGIIQLYGKSIPCTQIDCPQTARKVTSTDHYIVPAHSEQIIDVFIDGSHTSDFDDNQDLIIEPTGNFCERYQLAMAATFVNVQNQCTVKVRVMNPFPTDSSIKQDAVIGIAEPVDQVASLLEAENDLWQKNLHATRRIELVHHDHNSSEPAAAENSSNTSRENLLNIDNVPVHLKELYQKASADRSDSETKLLAEVLMNCKDAFSKDDADLGLTHLGEHSIHVGEAKPIKQRPRRTPLAFAGEEQTAIKDLESKKIIRKSSSPWASPIVLVRQKNGKVRPCVDYRQLNTVTQKDAFPLPRIQDCLDAVAKSTLFSTFYLTSGYHQIPVKEEDISKTAFVTKCGLFEFTAMPFGLCNAPATFQRIMELALHGLQWQTCIIYLDDIIVYGATFEEHMNRVEEVLKRMIDANFKLRPEKCQLLQPEVTFLGHVVSADGVRPNPDNVAKILQWPPPATVTEVRQFLGMASYYRRFICDFASIAKPLVDLTRKNAEFMWTQTCQCAFDSLKQILIGPEIMGYPTDDGDFILDTDACDVSIGAVLCQVQDGRERVLACASRTLNRAEQNYCVTDKELLALRYFVEYFRQYLLGRQFTVRTDHQALVWLFSLKEPKGRIARWIEILSGYNFSVEFRRGKKHENADAMSRCPNPQDCECSNVDTTEILKCGPCKKCLKRTQDMSSKTKEYRTNTEQNKIQNKQNPSVWKVNFMMLIGMIVTVFCIILSKVRKGQQDIQNTLRAVNTRSKTRPEHQPDESGSLENLPAVAEEVKLTWTPWTDHNRC